MVRLGVLGVDEFWFVWCAVVVWIYGTLLCAI